MIKRILSLCFLATPLFAADVPTEQLGNWSEAFTTKVGTIRHEPTKTVLCELITGGKGVNINSPSFNGVPLLAPLNLSTNSTRAQFVAAMKAAGIYTGN